MHATDFGSEGRDDTKELLVPHRPVDELEPLLEEGVEFLLLRIFIQTAMFVFQDPPQLLVILPQVPYGEQRGLATAGRLPVQGANAGRMGFGVADDADRHALGAELVERCFEPGIVPDGRQVILHVLGVIRDIVADDGASRDDPAPDQIQEFDVVGLPGVDEDEIEIALNLGDLGERVSDPHVYDRFQPGPADVLPGLCAARRIELDRHQTAAGLPEGQAEPEGGISREGADLQAPFVAVPDDEVMEEPAVPAGDVHVLVDGGKVLEEGNDPGVLDPLEDLGEDLAQARDGEARVPDRDVDRDVVEPVGRSASPPGNGDEDGVQDPLHPAVALHRDVLSQADQEAVLGVEMERDRVPPGVLGVDGIFRAALGDDLPLNAHLGEVILEMDRSLRVKEIGQPRTRLPFVDEDAVGVLGPAAIPVETHLLNARGRLQDEAPFLGGGC